MDDDLVKLQIEISSLTKDIDLIQAQHSALLSQVACYEAEHNVSIFPARLLLTKPKEIPAEAQDEVPPVIHYNFFDESIQKYFRDTAKEDVSLDSLPKLTEKVLAPIITRTGNGKMLLIENISRFGGMSTFPINQHLYDTEDFCLLGLRFDVMDHTTKKYLHPYYILLRRKTYPGITLVESNLPWLVFRYTTPAYIALDKHSKLLVQEDIWAGLEAFTRLVRLLLVVVQYKREEFTSVEKMTYASLFGDRSLAPLAIVKKDAEFSEISLNISDAMSITILCGDTEVTGVLCSASLSQYDSTIRSILVSPDCGIASAVEEVYKFLRTNSVI